MSTEDLQRDPGDYEAQKSQGPITLHSEEHLVTSDKGVAMYRRLVRKAIHDVASGAAPANVVSDPDAAPIQIVGGNYLSEPADCVRDRL